jgi:hypothetical protein
LKQHSCSKGTEQTSSGLNGSLYIMQWGRGLFETEVVSVDLSSLMCASGTRQMRATVTRQFSPFESLDKWPVYYYGDEYTHSLLGHAIYQAKTSWCIRAAARRLLRSLQHACCAIFTHNITTLVPPPRTTSTSSTSTSTSSTTGSISRTLPAALRDHSSRDQLALQPSGSIY